MKASEKCALLSVPLITGTAIGRLETIASAKTSSIHVYLDVHKPKMTKVMVVIHRSVVLYMLSLTIHNRFWTQELLKSFSEMRENAKHVNPLLWFWSLPWEMMQTLKISNQTYKMHVNWLVYSKFSAKSNSCRGTLKFWIRFQMRVSNLELYVKKPNSVKKHTNDW